MPKPPHNIAALERAIRQMAGTDRNANEVRMALSSVIAGQFLDGAVMRGGGSLKLRYGAGTTRVTEDFDASRKVSEDEFVASYNRRPPPRVRSSATGAWRSCRGPSVAATGPGLRWPWQEERLRSWGRCCGTGPTCDVGSFRNPPKRDAAVAGGMAKLKNVSYRHV